MVRMYAIFGKIGNRNLLSEFKVLMSASGLANVWANGNGHRMHTIAIISNLMYERPVRYHKDGGKTRFNEPGPIAIAQWMDDIYANDIHIFIFLFQLCSNAAVEHLTTARAHQQRVDDTK